MSKHKDIDLNYQVAYLASHEVLHWQLFMMRCFYNITTARFAKTFDMPDGDHAREGSFGRHLNSAYFTYRLRTQEAIKAERILPEQVCAIKKFLEDFVNHISEN